MLIVEGVRLKASWLESWPEASWAMDSAVYCSEDLYYSWVEQWLLDTEPEGGFT
jgi:hypothetical protein